jgi:predicted permease
MLAVRGVRFFKTIWQDLRFALRTMRKTPVFSLILVLTLALGIGANTAMFSVIHAVLLKPLGYQDADRVVLVSEQATPIRFEEMRLANQSCTELGAFANGFENVALSGMGEPEVLKGARVSANFLRILGVSALIGRSFRDDEDKPGALPVVMLSDEVWQRRFGRDTLVIGRSLTLDGTPHTVIGVLPAEFQFPFAGADIWLARPSEWSVVPVQSRPMSPILSIFGRLKPRVDMQQANAELALLNRQYAIAHPEMLDAKPDAPERVRPLKDQLVSDIRAKLWMLFGAVALVLLIVCANVASMLLARSTARSRADHRATAC